MGHVAITPPIPGDRRNTALGSVAGMIVPSVMQQQKKSLHLRRDTQLELQLVRIKMLSSLDPTRMLFKAVSR